MGGKSTYLRQAALIAILAQMGSFVPADSALLPIIDRIFTRIGASDNLARGRSTFMVEMTETAVILNTATPRSFIILDEIGRGTATYDGLALAWAVVEHIHQQTRAKTLFATHYHELTELAEQLDGVRNLRVAVKEAGDRIIFLRRVEPGKADRSYGIEVARLAGLPIGVIERAREVLKFHERTEHAVTGELAPRACNPLQIRLFEPSPNEIIERIRALKIDEMRPIEALRFLEDLQKAVTNIMRVAGIMSGTSLDGIDVAIVDIEAAPSQPWRTARSTILPRFDTASSPSPTPTPTPPKSRASTSNSANFTPRRCSGFAAKNHIPVESVELIGCHGQTIYHEHRKNTLQIGEGAVIAERTGIPVVSDFRTADIAAGGAGAPLVPFLDYRVFRHPRRGRIALNIGGIANITIIPAGAKPDAVLAFDTGPGNMVMDALTQRLTQGRQLYDRDGRDRGARKHRSSSVVEAPARSVLPQKAAQVCRPRTIWRGLRGQFDCDRNRITGPLATATAFTASTIALAVPPGEWDLIASGGGVHNDTLMAQLTSLLPSVAIAQTSDFGIDVDAKEAIAFALLAFETYHRRPGNLPAATGARHGAVLGKLSCKCK